MGYSIYGVPFKFGFGNSNILNSQINVKTKTYDDGTKIPEK
jgi:hypothetical protein